MKKILFFCLLMILCFKSIIGDTLKGGFPSCVTKEKFTQIMTAYARGNKIEYEYLLKNGCYFLPGGLKIAVLEQSLFKGYVKVRIFAGDQAVVMWTNLENIKRENN